MRRLCGLAAANLMRFLFLFQAGAIQDKVCVATITPVQQQLQQLADPLLQVLAAVA